MRYPGADWALPVTGAACVAVRYKGWNVPLHNSGTRIGNGMGSKKLIDEYRRISNPRLPSDPSNVWANYWQDGEELSLMPTTASDSYMAGKLGYTSSGKMQGQFAAIEEDIWKR